MPIWHIAAMSALAEYLKQNELTPTAFAHRLGRSQSTITRLLNGQRGAGPDLARQIERETDGAVSAAEVLAMVLTPPASTTPVEAAAE